ncbi:MAG: FAD-dependent oxidoreductase [Kastovskya adunca ATA6-11-RM4]|jgi:pyruvate/2-oxoglutarate dehydrogenase complex dihydrolipoamide dehydrogenase (E3) component|nr:FAD-dependent oxidoreductase [Kastovskya adunca ATA6-11-RM4]
MAVEYDLIVIGGSRAGIYAAVAAAHLQARVALVDLPTTAFPEASSSLYNQAIAQVSRVQAQLWNAEQWGIYWDETAGRLPAPTVRFDEAMRWAAEVVSTQFEQHSPAILGSLGVDVIVGQGEFYRRPHFGFMVNERRLRGRAYLLATLTAAPVNEIDGLQTLDYRTPADLWQQNPQDLQKSWVVIGGSSTAIELAQTLVRFNAEVTLVVGGSQILPRADLEASDLMQAQLEAEGVRVLTESPVAQVRQIDQKKWVQAGNQAIEADEILLATRPQPQLEGLNLEGVGVKFDQQGLVLNQRLQTTNPRIYALRATYVHIAQYEASIALKNALFFPWFKTDYYGIGWAIFTEPQLAQVGLTEVQARRRYGKDVVVVRQYFKTLDKAQILGETTGFCKFVVRGNGEILGAVIVGVEASELIEAIALLMRQNIKLNAIAQFPPISLTLSEILYKAALVWQRDRFSRSKTRQNFLESFFNLRRNWSS